MKIPRAKGPRFMIMNAPGGYSDVTAPENGRNPGSVIYAWRGRGGRARSPYGALHGLCSQKANRQSADGHESSWQSNHTIPARLYSGFRWKDHPGPDARSRATRYLLSWWPSFRGKRDLPSSLRTRRVLTDENCERPSRRRHAPGAVRSQIAAPVQ